MHKFYWNSSRVRRSHTLERDYITATDDIRDGDGRYTREDGGGHQEQEHVSTAIWYVGRILILDIVNPISTGEGGL